jgi:uncharacterized protein YndB with AHSA1/START domain
MTTPDVPLRHEFTIELPGTLEQVWDAIATGNGISSWFLPTTVEEREGGDVYFSMGPDQGSAGSVSGWEPPVRLEYSEPDWAALAGHAGAPVTPMVSEFVVEASSGGTCVLRVVSSAFGTGAEWEREFFDEAMTGWEPFFDNIRVYLTRFPGQRVTNLEVSVDVAGEADVVWAALRRALGADEVGRAVDVRGITGSVERISTPPPNELLLNVIAPVPGYLDFAAFDKGDGVTMVNLMGYLFAADAAEYVERERPAWIAWLEGLAVPAS